MRDLNEWVGRRVIINTDAQSFDGTLSKVRRGLIVLDQVTIHEQNGTEGTAEGQVVVMADTIRWVQVV